MSRSTQNENTVIVVNILKATCSTVSSDKSSEQVVALRACRPRLAKGQQLSAEDKR